MSVFLELKEISKTYGEHENKIEVLKNLNLQVKSGEFAVLMGSSGSGKSTLLNLLGGMDRPTSGSIIMRGEELNRKMYNEPRATLFRRQHIGFIFQYYYLLGALTAEENIALPLILSGRGKREIQKETEAMLRLVGLYDRRLHRPNQLSGGQQQRVAIARALVHRPSFLLADEPTGNLDAATTIEVMQLLSNLSVEYQQTLLLVTHDPLVAAYGNRVLFLKNGVIEDEWNNHEQDLPTRRDQILNKLRWVLGESK